MAHFVGVDVGLGGTVRFRGLMVIAHARAVSLDMLLYIKEGQVDWVFAHDDIVARRLRLPECESREDACSWSRKLERVLP